MLVNPATSIAGLLYVTELYVTILWVHMLIGNRQYLQPGINDE